LALRRRMRLQSRRDFAGCARRWRLQLTDGHLCGGAFPRHQTGRHRKPSSCPAMWPVEPTIAADKSLLSRRLTGAYRRPGAVGAGVVVCVLDGAGNCRAGRPPSAVARVRSLRSSRSTVPAPVPSSRSAPTNCRVRRTGRAHRDARGDHGPIRVLRAPRARQAPPPTTSASPADPEGPVAPGPSAVTAVAGLRPSALVPSTGNCRAGRTDSLAVWADHLGTRAVLRQTTGAIPGKALAPGPSAVTAVAGLRPSLLVPSTGNCRAGRTDSLAVWAHLLGSRAVLGHTTGSIPGTALASAFHPARPSAPPPPPGLQQPLVPRRSNPSVKLTNPCRHGS
jgi:hypothetical protein